MRHSSFSEFAEVFLDFDALKWNPGSLGQKEMKIVPPLESRLYAQDSQQINMEQNRLPKNQMKNTFKFAPRIASICPG